MTWPLAPLHPTGNFWSFKLVCLDFAHKSASPRSHLHPNTTTQYSRRGFIRLAGSLLGPAHVTDQEWYVAACPVFLFLFTNMKPVCPVLLRTWHIIQLPRLVPKIDGVPDGHNNSLSSTRLKCYTTNSLSITRLHSQLCISIHPTKMLI